VLVARVLGPTRADRRRAAVALGLALAVALVRAGGLAPAEIRTWRGVPDAAHVSGVEVDAPLGRRVDADAVENVATVLRRWDGVTVSLGGRLGAAALGVDIDIYASRRVPVRAGIADEEVDVLAEPRGHVGGEVVESFYELFDAEREGMRAFVEGLVSEMRNAELGTAAGARPLWRLAAEVYALRGYGFEPDGAMPLWLRPWVGRMARYLCGLAPPGGLVGLRGMRAAVGNAAPELLRLLERHYEVKLYGDAMRLIPTSVKSHRDAVARLRDALAEAVKAAGAGEAAGGSPGRDVGRWGKS
jgi:hypothetical protein